MTWECAAWAIDMIGCPPHPHPTPPTPGDVLADHGGHRSGPCL